MKATIAQLAAYVGKSERTMHRYLASGKYPHKRLPGGLIEIEDSLLIAPESEQEGLLLAALQRVEQKLDTLSAVVATLTHSDTRAGAGTPPAKREKAATTPSQGELPGELTAWRDYCQTKGYPESTVKHAIDRGDIPVHHGKWKRGNHYILAAIDEEGKHAIDWLYGGDYATG